MNNERALFKLLLNHEFYTKYQTRISSKLIPEELEPVYDCLIECHDKYKRDITITELWEKFKVDHPGYTEAHLMKARLLFRTVRDAEDVGLDIAEEILTKAWLEELKRDAASKMHTLAMTGEGDISEVEDILAKIRSGSILEDKVEYVTTDLYDLKEMLKTNYRWFWNYPALQKKVENVGGGLFTVVGARTDAGKTAFYVSCAFGPKGWAEQGANVHIIANEEPPQKTLVRGVSAYTGMTRQEILENTAKASDLMEPIKDKMHFIDNPLGTMSSIEQVDNYVFNNRDDIDILIIDQLDHLSVRGKFDRSDQRYGSLYRAARTIAIKYNIYVIGITQASAEADGKLYYGAECLEGSKTAKQAHADHILCIGMENVGANDGIDNMIRGITLGKLKEGSKDGGILYKLNGALSRMEE